MQTSNQKQLSENLSVQQSLSQDSEQYQHTKTVVCLLAILSTFLLLAIWIMQNSVNAYYLQTYHKESPLTKLNNHSLWLMGGQIGDSLYAIHGQFTDNIVERNQTVIDFFNEYYAYTTEHKAKMAEQARIEAEKMKQQEIESRYKLSISAGDEIFFAGDSMMQGVAPHVQQYLQRNYNIKSVNLSKQSTGLAYPSFFNWPKTIEETLSANSNIKILVVFLGPNDPWDMPNLQDGGYVKYGTPEWDTAYRARMATVLQSAEKYGVNVIWITPPNMKKQSLNEQMIHLNQVMKAELEAYEALIIDSRELVGGVNNVYNDYLVKEGKSIKMRSSDGIHFSVEGQKLLARTLEQYLTIVP